MNMLLILLLTVFGTYTRVHSTPIFSTIPALVPFPDSFPVTASILGVDAHGHTTFVVLDPTDDTTVTQTEVIGTDYFSWRLSAPAAGPGLFGVEVCTRTGAPSLGGAAYECAGAFGKGVKASPTTIPAEAWGNQVVDIDPGPTVTGANSESESTGTTSSGPSSASDSATSTITTSPALSPTSPPSIPISTSSESASASDVASSSSAPTSAATSTRDKNLSLARLIAGGVIGGLALLGLP
ncbi:hypothetical protein C8F01DRAFT_1086088 [Mycena amicta]|nr:hypothetical protein C8F01DRAFT_1086088 [Mycena amicta]